MRDKVSTALAYLGKAGTIIVLVAETGKKVMSLCEE